MRTVILLPFRVLSPTTLAPSRIVDQPLPRARKDSSPDSTSNSDQNIVIIASSDSHEEILYQNISDNGGPISEAILDSLSELPFSTSSVVVSQVGPADEHPSGQSNNASDDSDYENSRDSDSESEVSQSAMQTV